MGYWSYTINGVVYRRSFWIGLKCLMRWLPCRIKHFFLPTHYIGVMEKGKTFSAIRRPFSRKLIRRS